MSIADEFRTRNWSIYAQWAGVISMILCFAVGIANIVMFWKIVTVVFGAICLASSLVILFIEVPLLLRICPTSEKFDVFIRKFSTNVTRAGMYLAMAALQWLSLLGGPTSLIAAAVLLTFTGVFYGIAALRKDEFMSSKDAGRAGRRADDCIDIGRGCRRGWMFATTRRWDGVGSGAASYCYHG